MAIRKHGQANDQQVDRTDDPGQGQGIQRTASQGDSGTMGMPESVQQQMYDAERREIIDGEG